MNTRRVLLICSTSVVGVVALLVLVAFLAPGLLLDWMEVNSSRRRVAHCQATQIARVVREHYLQQQDLPSRDAIANQLVQKQAFRECGQDPFTAADALKDPWGDEFCLLWRSASSMLVFSRNEPHKDWDSAAAIDAGTFRWQPIERGASCR